jgi:hypothetical protein
MPSRRGIEPERCERDDEGAFVAPYLTLMSELARQREHPLREVFNGLRRIARAGGPRGCC